MQLHTLRPNDITSGLIEHPWIAYIFTIHILTHIERYDMLHLYGILYRELTHIRASRAAEPDALIGCAGVVTGS